MGSVHALLDQVTVPSLPTTTVVTTTPVPAAAALIGTPALSHVTIIPDIPNAHAQFSFQAWQNYTSATGDTAFASANGTSVVVNIPGVSTTFPAIALSTLGVTSALNTTTGLVTFTVTANVNYNQVSGVIADVVTTP